MSTISPPKDLAGIAMTSCVQVSADVSISRGDVSDHTGVERSGLVLELQSVTDGASDEAMPGSVTQWRRPMAYSVHSILLH